jgi:hypothetical protein
MTTVNVLLTPLSASQKHRLALVHQEFLSRKPTSWVLAWTNALHAGSSVQHEEALREAYNAVWIPVLEGEPHGPAQWGAVLSEVLAPYLSDGDRRELCSVWDSVLQPA